ncbi:MAG: hypothetical protein NTZ13_04675 [Candidatus Parcubacteria bacterium]|nr:hypothetical protein [Candidatus Parcubacteria bacterium]
MNTTTTPKTHPRLAQLLAQGYRAKVKRFYITEAGLPAADVILEKRGTKPVYLNGVYGKDENVPGGKKHRFGKTVKEATNGVLSRQQKNKNAKREANRSNSNGGTGAGAIGGTDSAKRAGLGKGQTKK